MLPVAPLKLAHAGNLDTENVRALLSTSLATGANEYASLALITVCGVPDISGAWLATGSMKALWLALFGASSVKQPLSANAINAINAAFLTDLKLSYLFNGSAPAFIQPGKPSKLITRDVFTKLGACVALQEAVLR